MKVYGRPIHTLYGTGRPDRSHLEPAVIARKDQRRCDIVAAWQDSFRESSQWCHKATNQPLGVARALPKLIDLK